MPLHLPIRRFIQGSQATQAASNRFGLVQWVLARPLYRFQTFDLTQVPRKNRLQALNLELTQWTPFANSGYYIGWQQSQALVWAWDADKVAQAMAAQRLKPAQAQVVPESVLQAPLPDGLAVTLCTEGVELQHWRAGHLTHTRWLAQAPTPEEWLRFQRDAGMAPDAQQLQPPAPRARALLGSPWLAQTGAASSSATDQSERLGLALIGLLLWVPTLWFGFGLLKLQLATGQLQDQRDALQQQALPITQARSQALDYLARSQTLLALDTYPSQLTLMEQIAQALPKDNSYLKGWDFQAGRLKVTVATSTDMSTTFLIDAMQKAGPFTDVKAVPGRDPKAVTFEMTVVPR
jgi:hypothetical protein